MQPEDSSMGLYAVPYDFDFSGFVNAEYTKPGEYLRIYSLTEDITGGYALQTMSLKKSLNFTGTKASI